MGYYSHPRAPKGGFLKALGKIGGAVAGFVTGGPAGAVAGHSAGGRIAGAAEQRSPAQLGTIQGGQLVPSKVDIAKGIFGMTPIGIAAKHLVPGLFSPEGGSIQPVNGQCPVGYHLNKQASSKGPARSYCVRNRSMNPANGRAIGRAATRIKKGAKQYARVLRILGKKTGKMVPRGRKRS